MTSVFVATVSGDDTGFNAGQTKVQRLEASVLGLASGNRFRLTLKWGDGSSFGGVGNFADAITDMFVGQAAAAGDPYDFLSTPSRVTFSGANGATFVQGGTLVSDWVTLPETYDEAKAYLIAWNWNVSAPAGACLGRGTPAGAQAYYSYTSNNASTVNKSSYLTDLQLIGISKIEIAQTQQLQAAFAGGGALAMQTRQLMKSAVAFTGAGATNTAAATTVRIAFAGSGALAVNLRQIQQLMAHLAGAGSLALQPPEQLIKKLRARVYTGDRHMRRTGDDYAEALHDLLPQGRAWPKHDGTALDKVVKGLAQIMGYVDDKAADLLEIETDPTKTDEMLTEWETAFGLPDNCIPIPPSNPVARRSNLVQRITMIGAQDRAFFKEQAAINGMIVSIREWAPYMCGVSRCGDTRMPSLTDDVANFRWECGAPEIRFYWSAKLLALTGSYAGVDLFCLLRRWKPAHTVVLFDYQSFNNGDFSNYWYSGNIAVI